MTAEGDIDYTASPPAMEMTMAMPMAGAPTFDMRFVDGTFYMSLGEMTDGKFVKLDPSDPDSPLGDLGSMMDQVDQMDPAAMMERLEPSIDKVVYDGEEDVDGRSLDHYELTVDGTQLGKVMEIPDAATAQLPDSLTYDLWLDDENRMAQMQMDMPVQGTSVAVEMSVDDWGKDVSIEAPPADQITEMPDLGGMMHPSPTV
jgi:hypothetical protein